MKKPDVSKMYLDISNDAWMELMKQKTMKAYEAALGPAMDKSAKIAVEHGIAAWMASAQGKTLTSAENEAFAKRYNDAMM